MAADDPVWVDVLPSAKGFAADLAKKLAGVGTRTGRQLADEMTSAAGPAGAQIGRQLSSGLDDAQARAEKYATALQTARNREADAAGRVRVAEEKLAEAYTDSRSKGSQVTAAEQRLESARRQQQTAAEKAATATHRYDQAQSAAADATDESAKSARDAEPAVGGFATSLGDMAKRAGTFAAGVLAIGGAVDTAAQALEQGRLGDKLAAQLGATPAMSQRLGRIAGTLYANAYGDSLETVNEAIKGVMQNGLVMEGASAGQIQAITAKVLDLTTAFDQDLGPTTQAVGQIMRTGLAKNASEALDVLTRGFQRGADRSEDLLDTMTEYAVQFQKFGLDAKLSTGLLVQGMQAGARSSDLVADAIKEFSIRAVDGSATTAQGFEMIGLSADDMSARIAKGGPSARDALDLVLDRLRGMRDPTEQAQAAVALFGTQAEDLGTALYALDPSSAVGALGQVGGAASRMGQQLNDNAATQVETFKRSLQQGLVDVLAEDVIPVLESAFRFISANSGWLKPLTLGVGGFLAVTWAIPRAVDATNNAIDRAKRTYGLLRDGIGQVQKYSTAAANGISAAGARIGKTRFGQTIGNLARTAAAWTRAGTQAAISAGRQVAAGVRSNAIKLGGLIGNAGRTAAAWGRAGGAATLSATRQAAAGVKSNAVKFGGLIGNAGRAALAWGRTGTQAAISAGRQVAAGARANAVKFGGMIASLARLAGGYVRAGAAALLAGIRQRAAAVAMGVARGATIAMTVAQRLLNIAMRANPIGIIITALIAIGTALVTAYKKSKTFRDIVGKIGDVGKWVWQKVFVPFGDALKWLWDHTLGAVIDALKWAGDKIGGLLGLNGDGGVKQPRGNATGALLRPYAEGALARRMAGGGGLTPMAAKADVIPPNTWRVVGDRMTGNESYIPWDFSARSLAILQATAQAFGMALVPLRRGALLGLSTAVALAGGATLGARPPSAAAVPPAVPITASATNPTVADPGQIAKTTAATKALTVASTVLDTAQNRLTQATQTQTQTLGRLGTAGLGPTRNRILGQTVPALRTMAAQAGTHTTRAVRVLTAATVPLMSRLNQTANTTRATATRNAAAVQTSVNRQRGALGGLQTGLARTRSAWSQLASWTARKSSEMFATAAAPARRVLRGPVNAGYVAAFNSLNSQFGLRKKIAPVRIGFNTGGQVPGAGRGDIVPSMLEPDEIVIRRPIATRFRDFLLNLNSGQAEAMQAAGGINGKLAHFRRGGLVADTGSQVAVALARAVRFAKSMSGRPYVWGGSSAAGTDCSGYQAMIKRSLLNQRPFARREWATGSVSAGNPPPGFVSGIDGTHAIGVHPGSHTAGTLAGVNVESGGSHGDVRYGPPSVGANDSQFPLHFHVAQIGGRFVAGGDGAFDPTPLVEAAFRPTYRMIRETSAAWPGNTSAHHGTGIARKNTDTVKGIALKRIISTMGASTTAGSPEVKNAFRAIARLYGWADGAQWIALDRLINKESSWDPHAANATTSARGLGQKMTSLHGPIESTVQGQARWILNYIRDRYGTPVAAWAHHQRANSYDGGGWLPPGFSTVFNGTKKPEPVLTTRQWDDVAANTKGGDGPDTVVANLYLGDEFIAVVDAEIDKKNEKAGAAFRRGRR